MKAVYLELIKCVRLWNKLSEVVLKPCGLILFEVELDGTLKHCGKLSWTGVGNKLYVWVFFT